MGLLHLLCLAVLITISETTWLQKVLFPDDVADKYEAKCLDGTPAGYFISTNDDSNGWVIYLQGGGVCVTAKDCKERTYDSQGSSLYWEDYFFDNTNVLSDSDDGNPFGEFNKLWVPYCTGDTWTGTNPENEHVGGLATTGHNIITALLDYLHNTTNFRFATHLLFSGGSAGGIGVFHNVDFVADRVRQLGISAIVKATPQAGYYFPPEVILFPMYAIGSRVPFDFLASIGAQIIDGGYLNPACTRALGKQKFRCWDINVVQKYIKTPLFIAQNILDQNQIDDILLCPNEVCDPEDPTKLGLAYLHDYNNKSRAALREFAEIHKTGSVWAPACFMHTEDLCTTREVLVNEVSYADALKDWFFEGKRSVNIEECSNEDLACNTHCVGGCGDAYQNHKLTI
eukprot:m.338438 g.338438  ORF g.338438 m.338438 type:complete len:399 (-) comp18422_c0_seq1:95-1291(-)